MTKKARGSHEEALQKIVEKPHKIGLENTVLISKEVKLYDHGVLIGEPDIMAFDLVKGWVFGEYKCNICHADRAFHQNTRTYNHLVKHKVPINDAEFIIIYGDMRVIKRG